MKIGIITFWTTVGNYGTILQCYALQKYLKDKGHEVFLIRYNHHLDIHNQKDKLYKIFIKKILNLLNPPKMIHSLKFRFYSKIETSKKKFNKFKEKYLTQTEWVYNFESLKENPPQADIYIAGSDQIWNISVPVLRTENVMNAHFLNFGNDKIKRIAYAPSFGTNKLNVDIISSITHFLNKFSYISVREISGIEICRQCGIENAECMPDPTLLLSTDIYNALYQGNISGTVLKKTRVPYCFVYLLGNTINFKTSKIFDYIHKLGLNLIYVTANFLYDKYPKIWASIPEWIYLIEHAEFVITNSFHGSVFSILFNKKFAVVSLCGDFLDWNDRFVSLFQMMQIEDRMVKNGDFDVLKKEINWTAVNNKIMDIRNRVSAKMDSIIC